MHQTARRPADRRNLSGARRRGGARRAFDLRRTRFGGRGNRYNPCPDAGLPDRHSRTDSRERCGSYAYLMREHGLDVGSVQAQVGPISGGGSHRRSSGRGGRGGRAAGRMISLRRSTVVDFTENRGRAEPMKPHWKKWLIVAAVLLATHLASAWHYADRYARRRRARAIAAADARPVVRPMGRCDRRGRFVQLSSSGRAGGPRKRGRIATPGAEPRTDAVLLLGTGNPSGLGRVAMACRRPDDAHILFLRRGLPTLFGVMAIATARLYTKDIWALAITAFCTGYCPPLQSWFYGASLTSSEIVSFVPLSLLFFVLGKAFIAYRSAAGPSNGGAGSSAAADRAAASLVARRVGSLGLALVRMAGLLIGLYSLARDSGAVFATFVACFLVGRAVVWDRRRLPLAISAAAAS